MTNRLAYVISELLSYRQSSATATKQFPSWKHNRVLCPRLEEQLNRVRSSFLKYESVAYDIQGMHDQGTDVLLRYQSRETNADDPARFIAFQIKADADLEGKDYLKILRSQIFQAQSEYREQLDRYYVFLCFDLRRRREEYRAVNKALSNQSQIVVVSPRYALTFLRLSELRITSLVDSFLREEDEVLKAAKTTVASMSPTQAAVLLAATCEATFEREVPEIDLSSLSADAFVQKIYERSPDYSQDVWEVLEDSGGEKTDDDDIDWERADRERVLGDRFAEDIDHLDDNGLSVRGGTARVNVAELRPIQALLLDAHVRYGYINEEAKRFVFDLLGVMEGYGLEGVDEIEELAAQ